MRWLVVSTCVLVLSLPAMAQESVASRAVVFGGYSYLRNNGNGLNGWEGQGTFNFNRFLGITADISGNSRSLVSLPVPLITPSVNQSFSEYLFGPTVSTGFGRSSVFAHALFGVVRTSLGAGVSVPIIGGISAPVTSASAFAMAFGGGLDLGLSKHFAIRVAQVDYVRSQLSTLDSLSTGLFGNLGGHQNDLRYSAGIVIRF
ncbi:MAG TPA: hypothetical protein VEV41_01440 [Terriglobales bacterium]|jgi:hypothetical protein|nr:hypothetical protein [Terriglobales bacterium]